MNEEYAKAQRAARTRTLQLPTRPMRQCGTLTPPLADDVLVSASMGPAGQVLALWSDPAGRDKLLHCTGRFANTIVTPQVSVRVRQYNPAPGAVRELSLGLAFPLVQPLPADSLLIAGTRCRNRAGGPEHNAAIYHPDGTLDRTGVLGDGIAHLRTTSAGEIWAGYFDEGVFGSFGWADEPLGAAGLARFDANLWPVWHYEPDAGTRHIADCYALNIAGDTVWLSYYTGYEDFPVVQLRHGGNRAWRNEVAAHAIATDGYRVALASGYEPERDLVALGTLVNGRVQIAHQVRLTLPDGSELPESASWTGHGAELHVLAGTGWYQLSLFEL